MKVENRKPNEVEAPTMFIGVGGTGCKIIRKVYDYCMPEERENVGFVCLDTNVNDLNEIKKNCKGIACVQTSNTQTVGSYLDIDQDASKNWFPKNSVIYDKTVSEGAGQLRAISRLAFNSTIKTGKIAPLFEAIDGLFKKNGQAMKQALRLCVVSTASGGTGSGMILPFCMFVRDYVNNKYPNASVILRTLILLPETLDKVIKSNIEKDSQRRNAYATIKEINAFMMKGSGFCEIEESLKRYRNLHIDVTDPGRKELKTLSLLPCDFCFLLDGQDAEDATSNSFAQYQDQAALALYEQNIGPMQKYAFSVEDNIIKELSNPGNYGRNRFGGVGAGRIVYPYEDIADYIAYDWARNSIGAEEKTSRWNKYDAAAKAKRIKEEEQQIPENEMTKYEAAYVDSLRNDTQKFSKDLVNHYHLLECESRVEFFLNKIQEKAAEAVNSSGRIKSAKEAISDMQYQTSDDRKLASADYDNLVNYMNEVGKNVTRIATNITESILYNEEKTMIVSKNNEFIESLMKVNDHYCHPNAARYILYSLKLKIDEKRNEYSTTAVTDAGSRLDDYIREGEEIKVPGSKRKEPIKSLEGLCEVVTRYGNDDKRKEQKEAKACSKALADRMDSFKSDIENFEEIQTYAAVYSVLSVYVESLCKEYKRFFETFPHKVKSVGVKQKDLLKALSYKKGDSVYNVCSTKEQLEVLSKSTESYCEKSSMLDDELNATIFDEIKANVRAERNRLVGDISLSSKKDIFDDVLLKYFKDTVRRECAGLLDMHILRAIVKQKEIEDYLKVKNGSSGAENDINSGKDSHKENTSYIKDIVAKGEKISAPGIQRMVGEEAREVNVLSYNKSLRDDRDFDTDELLANGAAVDTVSKYELHFFNALYNITPDKLKKFAAPKKSETGNRVAGLYHNAYTTYTKDIGPDCLKSSKMTTHIDRRWDSIAAMPELDLDYQMTQFLRTHKALIYGLVFHRIEKLPYLDDNAKVSNPAMAYRYRNTHNHIEDMIVSNGSLCDEFYEILDSLYIDRKLVEDIYDYESISVAKDVLSRKGYDKTQFAKDVDEFKLSYDDLNPAEIRQSSLFEIPLAYYYSLPSYMHDESELNSLVQAVIDVFRTQIQKYESEKNAKFILCEVLQKQYDLLMDNYQNFSAINKEVNKSENKVLEIVERKIEDVFESSPQPDGYEDAINNMKSKLKEG